MKIMVTGGGTGGHIYPALSIADAFVEKIKNCQVVYVGSKKGIEADIVPKYGYDFHSIEVSGFQRKISVENFKRGFKLLNSMGKVIQLLRKERPDLVIGTGGYVSGPVVLAASWMGIPTAIHEQNVFPGVTNRILSTRVDTVFLGFEDAAAYFPKAKEVFFTGNPIRTSKFNVTKRQARTKLEIPEDMPMILSVGGSGGSASLNNALREMMPQIVIRDIALVHVTGDLYYSEFMNSIESIKLKPYQQVVPYLNDIADYMAGADLIIASAGATSIAEINYLGKPSIIIPKSYSAENHQEYNAKMIQEAGAGFYILEKDLNATTLREKVYEILVNDDLRYEMENASKNLSKKKPEDIICNYMIEKVKLNSSEKSKDVKVEGSSR